MSNGKCVFWKFVIGSPKENVLLAQISGQLQGAEELHVNTADPDARGKQLGRSVFCFSAGQRVSFLGVAETQCSAAEAHGSLKGGKGDCL